MNGIGPLVSAYVHTRHHGHHQHAGATSPSPSTDPTASTSGSTTSGGALANGVNVQAPAAAVQVSDAARARFDTWMARHEDPTAGATVVPAPAASSDPVSLASPTA